MCCLQWLQLKSLLNAIYFGADHVVWASQAGLTTNKALVDRAQKVRTQMVARQAQTGSKARCKRLMVDGPVARA